MLCQGRFDDEVHPLEEFPACLRLVRQATSAFQLRREFDSREYTHQRLNVILRRYAPGDWLGRHVDDVQLFDEPVLSVVLVPGGDSDGLLLTLPESEQGVEAARRDALVAGASELGDPMQGLGVAEAVHCNQGSRSSFSVQEGVGVAICLEGESRYLFGHEVPPVASTRISMTWRWLREDVASELEEVREWLQQHGAY